MCNCRLRGVPALVVILVGAFAAHAHDFRSDRGRVNRAIQDAGYADPGFDARLKARQKELQPLFVVIPGILGSKLMKGDDVVWGKINPAEPVKRQDLEFAGDPGGGVLTPEFMDAVTIKWLTEVDVYGTLRDDLRFTNVTGVSWYDDFPYDWRDDIRASAKSFHVYLLGRRDDFRDRDVVFIAHSMGGLVVRWWYDAFYRSPQYQAEYAFLRSPRIVFLGVPHYGSVSALLRLIHGFSADSSFKGLKNFMVKGLNGAAPSFYSVYQLLPFNDSAIELRSIEGPPSVVNDPLSVEFWRTCRWGTENRDPDEFYDKTLPKRLEAAREFRNAMLHQQSIPNSICFYSDSNEGTPLTLRVWQHSQGQCTVTVHRRQPGDGTVPAEITRGAHRPDHPHAEIYRLQTSHMALPNAEGFRSYVHQLRTRTLVQSVVRADPTEKVIKAFRGARALFPLPLDMSSLSDPETKQAINLNHRILGATRSAREVADEVYAMAERARDKSDDASQLFALSIALDPDGPHAPYAANNLAHNLLEHDYWFAARGYLEHAQRHISQVPAKEKNFLATLETNTGVALEKTGEPCKALEHYARGGKEGRREGKRLKNEMSDPCPSTNVAALRPRF